MAGSIAGALASGLRAALAGIVLSLLPAGLALAGPEIRVAENFYLVPDARAKFITFWMVVNAGCRDEEAGQCRGLAHYLEHLMFLGRSASQAGAIPSAFSAGQTNAYTTMTATAYFQTTPARPDAVNEDLEKLFTLFSGRLKEVSAADDAAARERNVVLQEYKFRRTDSPRSNFYRAMNKRLQPEHPISQSVIGTIDDINALTLERARAFHEKWYGKSNTKFIVHGPVSEADLKPLIAKYIDPIPDRKAPQRAWLDARRSFEPMDETLRMHDPESARTDVLLERIVRFEDGEPGAHGPAYSILFDYLNSQIKGGLSDIFVEGRKMATQINASSTPLGAGVMWYSVQATLEDGVTPEAMKDALDGYFSDLSKSGMDAATFARLKRRRLNNIEDTNEEPPQVLSAMTSWFASNRSYTAWQARRQTLENASAQMLQPALTAMGLPGRQAFGVLSPGESAK